MHSNNLIRRFVTDAILVIDIEEVFDAKMTFSPQTSSN